MSSTSNISRIFRSFIKLKLLLIFKKLFGTARKLINYKKKIDNLDQILNNKKELK
jgi:hypothetical protein